MKILIGLRKFFYCTLYFFVLTNFPKCQTQSNFNEAFFYKVLNFVKAYKASLQMTKQYFFFFEECLTSMYERYFGYTLQSDLTNLIFKNSTFTFTTDMTSSCTKTCSSNFERRNFFRFLENAKHFR